eukprot:g8958.t1
MSAPALQHASPRGFDELRGIIIELVEEGSALGLTAAELFLQFGDRACTDGIGRRELRDGLASLSVHLSEVEVGTLLTGAGCNDEDEQNPTGSQLLTLEKFLAMVEKPTTAVVPPPPAVNGSTAAAPSVALDAQQLPPDVDVGEDTSLNRDDGKIGLAAEDGDGCVTPDSLVLAPRMSLSELLVDVPEAGGSGDGGGNGDGPGTSSSAAAHVEAFGRVAANVQAVLATAISRSGSEHGAAGDDGSGGGGFGGHDQHPSAINDHCNQRSSNDATKARSSGARTPASNHSSGLATQKSSSRGRVGAAGPEQNPAAQIPPSTRVSTSASRSGPVPRTGAISPPLGSARSPSEPLHPTRASRERLEVALEGLDLKERLRPTASVGRNGQGGDGGGGDDDDGDSGARGTRSSYRSAGARLPGGSGLSRRLASIDAGDGTGTSGGRRVSAFRERLVAGVDQRGARVRRPSGRASGRAAAGAGAEQRRRLGEMVDLAAAERGDLAAYDGGSEEAPEVIGRLRARVAELELSEQLLRCELEGARADLVSKGRHAEEEVQREVNRARERERALQAKMGARLRAAEAEAVAAEKRIVEIKRTSAAEAAAREKSSADYLRRRLKEMEATVAAKTARRSSLSKQHQHQHQLFPTSRRRQGRRRESWGEDNGTDYPGGSASGGGMDGGRGGTSGSGWGRPRARKGTGAPGELSGGRDADAAAVMARLREELGSCRKQLSEVTAEASRLRKEIKRSEKGDPRRETQLQAEKKPRSGEVVGGAGRRAGRPGKTCAVCGQRSRGSRQRQRERERRLEARIAESEEARIEVEAEAGRLQAFLDEMRGLRPLFVQPWRGGGNGAAAE